MFYAAIEVQRLPQEGLIPVTVQGMPVLVGWVQGRLVVILDRCPHANVPLSEGAQQGTVITCHKHGWAFNMHTGESVPEPSAFALKRFPVKVEAGTVWVDLEA
jgi:nitrite reductase/ring-hydroxylating ferredoxin subunit